MAFPSRSRWRRLGFPAHALIVIASLTCGPAAATETTLPLTVEPAYQRVDLAVGEERSLSLVVRAPPATSLLAIDADCACIQARTRLPLVLPADGRAEVELRVVGMGSGAKPVTVRSTAGAMTVSVQVVCAGLGVGRDTLAAAARTARERGERAIVVVHDLRGQLRNCGCTAGSLGGIDRLAALPATWRALEPTAPARFVLSGDSDGSAPGVGDALARYGWSRGDPEVVVASEPSAFLQRAGISAIVVDRGVAVQHRRLVRPPLSDGMMAMVLLIGADGEIDRQQAVPIDQTLPGEATILAEFPDTLSRAVVTAPISDACLACHAGAHARWSASAHARAWQALSQPLRTDACVACHSAPVDPATITAGVHCQSCHLATAAHLAEPSARTGGTVDCRSCHDARHHPEFDHAKAWEAIRHE